MNPPVETYINVDYAHPNNLHKLPLAELARHEEGKRMVERLANNNGMEVTETRLPRVKQFNSFVS